MNLSVQATMISLFIIESLDGATSCSCVSNTCSLVLATSSYRCDAMLSDSYRCYHYLVKSVYFSILNLSLLGIVEIYNEKKKLI